MNRHQQSKGIWTDGCLAVVCFDNVYDSDAAGSQKVLAVLSFDQTLDPWGRLSLSWFVPLLRAQVHPQK